MSKWFKKRGFYAFPVTWQGWLVTAFLVGMIFIATGLFVTATTVTGAVLAIILPALEFSVKPLEKTGTGDHEVSDLAWVAFEDLPSALELAFDHEETIALYMEYRQRSLE